MNLPKLSPEEQKQFENGVVKVVGSNIYEYYYGNN